MKDYTTVKEQVEYGLSKISDERTVEVPLRDLLYVYKTLGEIISFFHQPTHYPKLEDVNRFMGSQQDGAFQLLHECYYEKLRNVWPEDIDEMFDNSDFDHPLSPYFFEPTDET